MKKPNETQRIPDPTKQTADSGPHAGSITSRGRTEFEQRIGAILRAEAAAEAADALGMSDAELDASSISAEESFADALRAKWQADDNAAQGQPSGRPNRDGQTAILPRGDAHTPRGPLSLVAGSWWAGGAAAAVLAGAVGLYGPSSHEKEVPNAANSEASTEYATYLGAAGRPSSSQEGEVSERGPSTVPRILPKTVDFSEHVSMAGTFLIEIHDTDRDARIDDVPGDHFHVTVFEPRWTCSEANRAKLPAVFWLKVFRSVDPHGSGYVWKELFARQ